MLGDGVDIEGNEIPLEVADIGGGETESDADGSGSAGSSSESDSSSQAPFDFCALFSDMTAVCPTLVVRLVAKKYPAVARRSALNVYGLSENSVTPSRSGRTVVMESITGPGLLSRT
jgi:hypothetical protein